MFDTSGLQISMTPKKAAAEGDLPTKQVNVILQNLRGEHFRHARNVQGKSVFSGSFSSRAHNQPTLPTNLIYPSPAPETGSSWVPGPSLPRSWRSSSSPTPNKVKNDVAIANTTTWRECALSPLFSAPASSSSEGVRSCLIYPDPSPIPQLTLLCLQCIRFACPGADLADVVPYIPLHLRRALLRYTAIHAPLSQTELDVLCQGTTHVDTELIIVGPHNTLRASSFRKHDHAQAADGRLGESEPSRAWDATPAQDSADESPALRALAVLSSPLSASTLLAFPPTITHLALINIPHRISLQRLPTICPLLVFLDLSYNAWLCAVQGAHGETSMLEEIEWPKLRRLEVVGLRACPVTPKVLLELNRGRWEVVKVVR